MPHHAHFQINYVEYNIVYKVTNGVRYFRYLYHNNQSHIAKGSNVVPTLLRKLGISNCCDEVFMITVLKHR